MAEIIVEVKNKRIIFTNWYQNIGYQWIRASSTIGTIVIVPALHDYYVPTFNYDTFVKAWGDYYHNLYGKIPLQDLQATKDRVDKFLIEVVPRINKLLAFI